MQWSLTKRPHTLSDLYGCDNIKKYFSNAAKKNSWPTAVLFTGKWGCGKTSAAMIAAQMMVCKSPKENGDPCCECDSCRAIIENKFNRDVVLIDGGQSSKDDIIEKVTDFTRTAPLKDKRKIMIIEEVQELSTKAKNSMLKILETSKKDVHFLFTSMDNMSSSGFLSRCQTFRFPPASVSDVMMFLKQAMETEGLWENTSIPNDFKLQGLATIASNCDGSYRQALQLLQQCIESEVFSETDIREQFGLVNHESLFNILMSIMDGKADTLIQDSLINGDYNQMFNLSYTMLSTALQYKVFGSVENKTFEAQAAKLSAHSNFDATLNTFKKMSESARAGYLKKTDYIVELCQLIQALKKVPEPTVVRRIPVRGAK